MIIFSDGEITDKDNPFNDDILGNRKAFGKSLENLINKCGNNQPLVIGLDGQWGEGKTYFLERWRQELENEEKKTIYLDGFQSDYIDDPFFAVISEIYQFLERVQTEYSDDHSDELKCKIEELSKKTNTVISYVGQKAADGILNKLTNGEIDTTDINKLSDILSHPLLHELVSEEFITKYSKYKEYNKNFESFKKCLFECAQLNFEITGFPIVFVIDELDRCKPTYALELLEKIKHFFSVKGIVFILSMNKKQLTNSIKNIYGIESDADLYLQKFLTIEASMPKSLNHLYNSSSHYKALFDYYAKEVGGDLHYSYNINTAILQKFDFTFRDCQKTFTYYSIVNADESDDVFSFLLAVLKVKRPDVFSQFKEQNLDHSVLIENVLRYNREADEKKLRFLINMILAIWEIPKDDQDYISDYEGPQPMLKTKKDYLEDCKILELYKI